MVANRERPLGIAVRDLESGEYIGITLTGPQLSYYFGTGELPPHGIAFDTSKVRPLTDEENRRWDECERW